MLEYDFESSLGYWICMTSHLYEQALNEELTPRGITYRQFQVLGWLAIDGELSQTELAVRMKIEPPTLVKILDCMQRDELIRRDPSPHDRRRNIIRAQPKVRPLWSKMVACAKRVRQRAAAGLTDEQTETLKCLLQKVQQNLGAPPRVNGSLPRASLRSVVGKAV